MTDPTITPAQPLPFNEWITRKGTTVPGPDEYRDYVDYANTELLRNGLYDDQLAAEIEQEVATLAAESGVTADPNDYLRARRPDQDFDLLTRRAIEIGDDDMGNAVRTYQAVKGSRDIYDDEVEYQRKLEEARLAAEPFLDPERVNDARRAALDRGDLPFVVIDQGGDKPPLIQFGPAAADIQTDEDLAAAFDANPDLDRRFIGAVRQKIQPLPGFDAPAWALDRQMDFQAAAARTKVTDTERYRLMVRDIANGNTDAFDRTLADLSTDPAFASFTPDERRNFLMDMAKMQGQPEVDPQNVAASLRTLSTGQVHIPDAVMFNKGYFDQALQAVPEGQHARIKTIREAHMEAVAPEMFKGIAEFSTFTKDDPSDPFRTVFVDFYEQAKAAGKSNGEILDEWMSNPDNHSKFWTRARGLTMGAVSAVTDIPISLAALAGSEGARDILVENQRRESARKQYANLFGDKLGIGYDAANLIAPVGVDLTLAAAAGPTGGATAGLLAAKTGAKAVVKSALRRSLSAETKTLLSQFTRKAAARQATRQGLDTVTTPISTSAVLTLAGRDFAQTVSRSATQATVLGTAFTRSAGSTYASLHATLSNERNADGTPRYTPEQVREIALGHGLTSGAITASVVGAFQFLGAAGVERLLSGGFTPAQARQIHARLKLNPEIAKQYGVSLESPEKMIESAVRNATTNFLRVGVEQGGEEFVDQMAQSVNEALATGERFDVVKATKDALYAGTLGFAMGAGMTGAQRLAGRPLGEDRLQLERRSTLLQLANKFDAHSPNTAAALRAAAAEPPPAPAQEDVPAPPAAGGPEQAPSDAGVAPAPEGQVTPAAPAAPLAPEVIERNQREIAANEEEIQKITARKGGTEKAQQGRLKKIEALQARNAELRQRSGLAEPEAPAAAEEEADPETQDIANEVEQTLAEFPAPAGTPTESLPTDMPTSGDGGFVRDLSKPEQMTPAEFRALWDTSDFRREFPTYEGIQDHDTRIEDATETQKPVSAEAVDTYGIELPEGYVRQGDLYVFQPQATAVQQELPGTEQPRQRTLSGMRDAVNRRLDQMEEDGTGDPTRLTALLGRIEAKMLRDNAEGADAVRQRYASAVPGQTVTADAPREVREVMDREFQEMLDAADNALPERAQEAVSRFTGFASIVREDPEAFGVMDARSLEKAVSGQDVETAEQIEAAFKPIRENLRAKFGDTITLYRAQKLEGEPSRQRYALSWTSNPKVSESFAGVREVREDFSEKDIADAEETFDKTGRFEIRKGYWLEKKTDPEHGDYIAIMDRSVGGEVTDTPSVRAFLEGLNQDRQASRRINDKKASRIRKEDIPLDDVVWVTDRGGQMEFIVRTSPSRPLDFAPKPKAQEAPALKAIRAKDFQTSGNYEVQTSDGVRRIFRDPESGAWLDADRRAKGFPTSPFPYEFLGYTKKEALDALATPQTMEEATVQDAPTELDITDIVEPPAPEEQIVANVAAAPAPELAIETPRIRKTVKRKLKGKGIDADGMTDVELAAQVTLGAADVEKPVPAPEAPPSIGKTGKEIWQRWKNLTGVEVMPGETVVAIDVHNGGVFFWSGDELMRQDNAKTSQGATVAGMRPATKKEIEGLHDSIDRGALQIESRAITGAMGVYTRVDAGATKKVIHRATGRPLPEFLETAEGKAYLKRQEEIDAQVRQIAQAPTLTTPAPLQPGDPITFTANIPGVMTPTQGVVDSIKPDGSIVARVGRTKYPNAQIVGGERPPIFDPIGYGEALIDLFPSLKKQGVKIVSIQETLERLEAEWTSKVSSGKANKLDQLVYLANKKNTESAASDEGSVGGVWTRSDKTIAAGPRATPSVIAHELGHALMELEYVNASDDVKQAVQSEYAKWFQAKYGPEGTPSVADQRRIWEWMLEADWMDPEAPFPSDQRVQKWENYRSSFREWFADEVAKWASTSEKPKNLVGKFFSELAVKMARLWNAIRGNFSPNKPIKDWLDSLTQENPPDERQQPAVSDTPVARDLQRLGIQDGSAAFLRNVIERGPKDYKTIARILSAFTLPNPTLVDLPDANYAGAFVASTRQILINVARRGPRGPVDTVMHELIHAALEDSLRNPTDAQRKILNRLERIRQTVMKRAEELGNRDVNYGLSSMDEFFTHFLTSPEFQRQIGAMTPKGQRNWVEVILDALRSLFGAKLKTEADKQIETIWNDMIRFTRSAAEEQYGPHAKTTDGRVLLLPAYHGTPHKVDKFSMSKIGTGEGAQAYGWGLYFTETESVAEGYRRKLSKESEGNVYQVELLIQDDELLDWDLPLSSQSAKVQEAIGKANTAIYGRFAEPLRPTDSGAELYSQVFRMSDVDTAYAPSVARDRTAALRAAGIKGVRYLDGASRNRPFKDIKKDFLDALPEDAEFADVQDAIDEGAFNADQIAFLKALEADDWFGFDYPAQAISAALSDRISNWDPSPELLESIKPLRGNATYNYVIFDENDIQITAENGKPVTATQATTPEPGPYGLSRMDQLRMQPADLRDLSRFKELTADLGETPTQADIDAWKTANPDKYAELQKMRETVLRDAGWDVGPAYHGTPNGVFTVFDQTAVGPSGRNTRLLGEGFYFTSDQKQALNYGDIVVEALLKIQNPRVQESNGMLQGRSDDQDGAIVQGTPGTRQGEFVYVVKNPNQIKSTEPLNLDADGRLITPDRWADTDSPDIRFQPAAGDTPPLATMLESRDFAGAQALADQGVQMDRKTFIRAINPEATQRATTIHTRLESAGILSKSDFADGQGLVYGDGKGLASSHFGAISYEPFPPEGFNPDYTGDRAAGEGNPIGRKFKTILNTFVLNVVDPQTREFIVKDIANLMDVGGRAVIVTRGDDVANSTALVSFGPLERIQKSGGKLTYQKGFTQNELIEYVKGLLGSGFDVNPVKGGSSGDVRIEIIKNTPVELNNPPIVEISDDIRFQPEPTVEQTPNTLRETAIGFLPDGFTLDDLDINFDQLAEDVSDTDPVNAEELIRSAVNYEVARVAAERELGDDYDPMFAETYYKLLTGNLPDADKAFYIGNPNAMERLIRFLTSALRRLTTAIELQFDRHTATAVNRISRALVDAERGFRVRPDYVMMGGDVTRMQPDNRDADYLAAVQRGDMETAQRMVDEAARAAGYNRKGVRFGFYVNGVPLPPSRDAELNFGTGYYVAEGATLENTTSSSVSVSPTANQQDLQRLGLKPEDVEFRRDTVFVKAEKPLRSEYGGNYGKETADFINAQLAYDSAVQEARRAIGVDFERTSWGKTVSDLIASGRLPFDSVQGMTGRKGMTSELVVQNASQIKSADPVTYDSNGNVIPLSQRFDSGSNDIRFQPILAPDNRISHFQDVYMDDPQTDADADTGEPRNWFQRMFVDRDDLPRPLSKLFLNRRFSQKALESTLKNNARDFKLIQKKTPADLDLVSRALPSNRPTLTKADTDRINAEFDARLADLWTQESAAIAARENARDEQLKASRRTFRRAGMSDPRKLGTWQTEYEKRDRQINSKAKTDIAAISADYRVRREQAMEQRKLATVQARLARADEMRRESDLALEELEKVNPDMAQWVIGTRMLIDDAQSVVKSVYGDSPQLQMLIDATRGAYMVRTYRIHQDPGYAKKFLTDPKYRKAYSQLINYFEDQLVEQEKENIRRMLGEDNFEITEEEITNSRVKNKAEKLKRLSKGENYNDADIEAIARAEVQDQAKTIAEDWIMGHGDSQTLVPQGSSSSIKVDFTRFLEKKDLDPVLLEALGEITDPVFNTTRTIESLATIAQNRKFLAAYVRTGTKLGNLISKEEYESNPSKYRGWDTLVGKDERSPAYAPLSGYYAPPEHILAFDAVRKQNRTVPTSTAGKAFDRVNRIIMGSAGWSLAFVVMGNTASAVRNIFGGGLLASRQGIVAAMTAPFKQEGRAAYRAVYEAIFDPVSRKVNTDVLNEYIALGVILNGVDTNYLREMYEQYGSDQETFAAKIQELVAKGSKNAAEKFGKVREGTSAAGEYIGKIWEFTETLYNVVVFENELGKLREAGFGTEQQMKQEAADRMRMLLPSHSEQSQGVREFTKSPVAALVAPFIRFKTDMIRTTVNTYRLAIKDMKSGNPVLAKYGRERLASALAVDAVLTAIVPQIMQAVMGIGDDEDEAIRSAMPDYAKNSNFIYYLDRSTGELTTWDLTYLNPMSFVIDPFVNMYRAVASGDAEEIPAIAAQTVGQEFLGENVLAGLVIDVKRNKDQTTGKSIYLDTDTDAEKVRKSIAHVVGGAYTPAVAKVLSRTLDAATRDQESDQFFFSPVGQAMNLFLPVKPRAQFVQDMAYRSFSETRAMNAQLWQTMSASRSPRPMDSSEIADMYQARVDGTLRVWSEFYNHAKGFEKLGMTRNEILATARRAGLSSDRTRQVVTRGTTDRPVESAEALEKMRLIDPDRVRVLKEEQSKTARNLNVTGK